MEFLHFFYIVMVWGLIWGMIWLLISSNKHFAYLFIIAIVGILIAIIAPPFLGIKGFDLIKWGFITYCIEMIYALLVFIMALFFYAYGSDNKKTLAKRSQHSYKARQKYKRQELIKGKKEMKEGKQKELSYLERNLWKKWG